MGETRQTQAPRRESSEDVYTATQNGRGYAESPVRASVPFIGARTFGDRNCGESLDVLLNDCQGIFSYPELVPIGNPDSPALPETGQFPAWAEAAKCTTWRTHQARPGRRIARRRLPFQPFLTPPRASSCRSCVYLDKVTSTRHFSASAALQVPRTAQIHLFP